MSTFVNERAAVSSTPEDLFVDLFAQVFGLEKVQLLAHDYPVRDIYGGGRFIDYAIKTLDEKIAFEIDGLTWHHPAAVSVEKFEDDLLRQNSLVHAGWRVFRWTDRELVAKPERVKEQLALFLENVPGLLLLDDFLPKQHGETLELRPHQDEALASLQAMREEGKTIALLTHAQGAGKTIVAISDAKRLGGRTLFLVHRRSLVQQAYRKFAELWPEASAGLFMGGVRQTNTHNVVGSIQSLAEHLKDFDPSSFDYIIIDEAHHAAASTYKRVLGYFQPRFVLGLTATPDRADGQSILELFQDCAHRLSLQEAIELGELVPIRCLRVTTNVDLSRVRFNQVQYNRRDIEETVVVPGRDRLIVQTYLDHVPGRKAVAFCVNVRHADALAELFRCEGIPAQSVSGQMSCKVREDYLAAFHRGDLRVLCACDILNEGWDCPDVEVLLMARPTLSKVIYMQQLGRGTRKAPGKDSLLVVDFVDNASRYNTSLSLHRVMRKGKYRPGGLVVAPSALAAAEEQSIDRGDLPPAILGIGIWAKNYQEIDLFSWRDMIADMMPVGELEVALGASEGVISRAIDRNEVAPDHILTFGERVYRYFRRDRVEEIRRILNLPRVTDENIATLFAAYVGEMEMTMSYKPVFLLAMLDSIDERGRAQIGDVTRRFRRFYQDRLARGLQVERASARMANVADLSDNDVQRTMLDKPFEKFERRGYMKYDSGDLGYIRFVPALWRRLTATDVDSLRVICAEGIKTYFERLQ